MKYGVLGTGMVGQAIAGKLVAQGHEVRMGSRDPAHAGAADWARAAGPRASVGAFADRATRVTDMKIVHLEDIGPHYARTLREWRESFLARQSEVRALGFDERFARLWEYYLAYCEAGFEERALGDVQMLFAKPENRRAPFLPGRV